MADSLLGAGASASMETVAVTDHEPNSSRPTLATGKLVPHSLREPLLLALLIGATLAAYWPVRHCNFIVLDDDPYVVNNPNITQLNWQTVKWSFTAFYGANWFPLTWLSHALDYRLFALHPGLHHETNLLLHILNALVLFWVLRQATGSVGRSWVVAALFALHPLNVESVAWIAERKNLLSMLFLLLALGAYHAYARKPRVRSYLVVAALYALGLMCKPQIITLPFVLLLWDYWPLERIAFRSSLFAFRQSDSRCLSGEQRTANGEQRSIGWLLLEKLPLLALSLGSALLTIKAQIAGGTMKSPINSLPYVVRLGNIAIVYVRYLGKAVWPTRLAFFYPYVRTAPLVWQVAAALGLLAVITFWTLRSRKHRYLAVGWLWFLGTLVPMVGFVQVGTQAMADRYAYLPFVGLFLAVSWGVADLVAGSRSAEICATVAAIAILLLLSLATRQQVGYWWDDLTLWTHTVQVTKNNWMAENMIGEDYLRDNDREASISHFRAAAAMEPLFPLPYLHVGIYEEEHRHPHEALRQLNKVLELTQPYADETPLLRSNALVYMSYAYNQLGDYANEQRCIDEAGRLQHLPR